MSTPSSTDAQQRTRILLESSAEFSAWVQAQAPGAILMLCGGLAFTQYGSQRATYDVDLCMDLSRSVHPGSTRRVDTNALKDIASRDPKLIAGPKIYWKHTATGTPVQVDFVDANLFWAPFDVRQMVDTRLPIPSLNLPTLLVGKLKCAIERSQSDPIQRLQKQSADVMDFDFAMFHCVNRRIPLTLHHLAHLGRTQQEQLGTVRAFAMLRRDILAPSRMDNGSSAWVHSWTNLVTGSGLSADFIAAVQNVSA